MRTAGDRHGSPVRRKRAAAIGTEARPCGVAVGVCPGAWGEDDDA
jgi:hypothetical protein